MLGGLSVAEINVLARGFADTPEGARYVEASQGAAAEEAPQEASDIGEAAGEPARPPLWNSCVGRVTCACV